MSFHNKSDLFDTAITNTLQQGIEVPEVLRKYIPGAPEFLPYVKELPKGSTSQQKAKGKQSNKPAEDAAKKMQDLKM